MEYRVKEAETEEQKQKERSFIGLGLTSRKNLCIHPEVRFQPAYIVELYIMLYVPIGRYLKRRRGLLSMPVAEISQMLQYVRKVDKIQAQLTCVTGMR